ncbi:hypothetical protein CF327_g4899 [Tilletia walkeri]|nr:hypothetical protein CF327_g4899 [Tilletia walkeri]
MASSSGLPSYVLPGTSSHSLYVPPSPTNNSSDDSTPGARSSGYNALFAPPIVPSNSNHHGQVTSAAAHPPPAAEYGHSSHYGIIDPALLLFGQQHVVTPPRVDEQQQQHHHHPHHPSYGYGTVGGAAGAGVMAHTLMNSSSLDPTLLIARDSMQLDGGLQHQQQQQLHSARIGTRESSRRGQPQPVVLAPQPPIVQPQAQAQADDADEDEALYCVCKKKDDGSPMVECALCEDWFHLRCVGLSKRAVDRLESYTCPPCSEKIALAKTNSKQGSKDKKRVFKSPPPSDRSSPVDSEADSVYEPPEEVPSSSLKRKSQSDESASKKPKTSPPPQSTQTKSNKVSQVLGALADGRKAAVATSAAASRPLGSRPPNRPTSSSSSSSASIDIMSMHDPYRDPVRKHCMEQFTAILSAIFAEQTALAAAAASKGKDSAAPPSTAPKPARPALSYAVTLETALFKLYADPVPGKTNRYQASKAYKDRFRSLIFSFKDKTNQALRQRIVSGEIPAARLARMSNAELANDEMRLKTERAKMESLANSILKKEVGPVRKMTHKGEVEVDRGGGGGDGGDGSSSSTTTTTSTRPERPSLNSGSKSLSGRPGLVKKESGSSTAVRTPGSGTPQTAGTSANVKGPSQLSIAVSKTTAEAPLPSFQRKASAQKSGTQSSATQSGSASANPGGSFNFGSLWTGSPTSEKGAEEVGGEQKDGDDVGETGASPSFSAQDGGIDFGDFGVSDDLIDNFLDESSSSAIAAASASAPITVVKKPTPSAPSGPRAKTRDDGPRKGVVPGKSALRPSAAGQRSTTPPKLPPVPKRALSGSGPSSSSATAAGPSQPPAGILKQRKPSEAKFPSTKVWSGALTMPDEGTFSGTVRQIGGRPLGSDPRIWPLFFPEAHTTIEGRLPSTMAEDYLIASTSAHRTEVVAFVMERSLFLPGLAMAGDEAPLTESANARSFEKVVGYFAGRGRYGVLGSDPSARGRIIKDFYIAALPKNLPALPGWLAGLVPGLETFEPSLQHPKAGLGTRSEDVFILAAVLFKGALDAELAMSAPPIPMPLGMSYAPPPPPMPSSSSAAISTDPLAGLLGAGGASALQDLLASVGAAGPSAPPTSQQLADPTHSTTFPAVTMPVSTASALAQVPTEKLEPLLLANPTLVDQLLASLKEQGQMGPSSSMTATATAMGGEDDAYDPSAAPAGIPGFAALAASSAAAAGGRSHYPPMGGPPPPPPPPPQPPSMLASASGASSYWGDARHDGDARREDPGPPPSWDAPPPHQWRGGSSHHGRGGGRGGYGRGGGGGGGWS